MKQSGMYSKKKTSNGFHVEVAESPVYTGTFYYISKELELTDLTNPPNEEQIINGFEYHPTEPSEDVIFFKLFTWEDIQPLITANHKELEEIASKSNQEGKKAKSANKKFGIFPIFEVEITAAPAKKEIYKEGRIKVPVLTVRRENIRVKKAFFPQVPAWQDVAYVFDSNHSYFELEKPSLSVLQNGQHQQLADEAGIEVEEGASPAASSSSSSLRFSPPVIPLHETEPTLSSITSGLPLNASSKGSSPSDNSGLSDEEQFENLWRQQVGKDSNQERHLTRSSDEDSEGFSWGGADFADQSKEPLPAQPTLLVKNSQKEQSQEEIKSEQLDGGQSEEDEESEEVYQDATDRFDAEATAANDQKIKIVLPADIIKERGLSRFLPSFSTVCKTSLAALAGYAACQLGGTEVVTQGLSLLSEAIVNNPALAALGTGVGASAVTYEALNLAESGVGAVAKGVKNRQRKKEIAEQLEHTPALKPQSVNQIAKVVDALGQWHDKWEVSPRGKNFLLKAADLKEANDKRKLLAIEPAKEDAKQEKAATIKSKDEFKPRPYLR